MITTSRNESAPAEVEGSTGATPLDVRGDGLPLRAKYGAPSSFRNVREVVYVSIDNGQTHTYQLKRSEVPPTRYKEASIDILSARVLGYDADASAEENEEYAKLVLNCLVATGTAKVAPLLVVRAVLAANHRLTERIRELTGKVNQLQADNESLYKQGRR
jgi:hypothetical protein